MNNDNPWYYIGWVLLAGMILTAIIAFIYFLVKLPTPQIQPSLTLDKQAAVVSLIFALEILVSAIFFSKVSKSNWAFEISCALIAITGWWFVTPNFTEFITRYFG